MDVSFHHVGQLVPDYEAALDLYEGVLGATVFETRTVRNEAGNPGVRMAFCELADRQIHLICRDRHGTEMDELLDTLAAVSPYHVAYLVSDLEGAIAAMDEAGFSMYDTHPTDGLGPYQRAFADPESVPGIPFEFIEPDR
jgi:catechol 2,3-dioxygenase-like lactoylglutathione lyase family enzyme